MIVVDATVLATALGDDGAQGRTFLQRIRPEDMAAPELIDLELLSAWRKQCATGTLTAARAGEALEDLQALSLVRFPHLSLLDRCWELRHNLTSYDAAYVALAELLGTTLLTADARLAAAPGIRCGIDLLADL